MLICLLQLFSASGFTLTPSMASPLSVASTGTQSYSWTFDTAGTYDCTLNTYNGEFKFTTVASATLTDPYVTGTYYQRARLSGTDTVLTPILSITYRPRKYYLESGDSFTPVVTDYLELVCNDGSTTVTSTTIIGINGGWIPDCQTTICSNNGNCNPLDGSCTCYYPYYGTTCQSIDCGNCQNGGTCTTTTGVCSCTSNYYGTRCEYTYCPNPSTSTNCNHGWCDFHSGTCYCYAGYSGHDCSIKKCLNDCNEGGVCSNAGVCTCYDNHFGTDCSYKKCPRDCGAYGGCNLSTGECYCYGVYSEKDCMFATCPGTTLCSGNGICNYYSGQCECNTGYAGVDCSQS